jgi:hypothetical protein
MLVARVERQTETTGTPVENRMKRTLISLALCVLCAQICLGAEAKQPDESQDEGQQAVAGSIYAIDTKLDLLMLEVGSDDGVKVLQQFLIYRPDGLVCHVTITSVIPTASAGLIDRTLPVVRTAKLGDTAVTDLKPPKKENEE